MLGGGIGCSRLAAPLAALLGPGRLTVIVNTADDLWRYGLRICPDLDTNLYALAGVRDQARGWGVASDSFRAMNQLRKIGHNAWFNLGDLDLATHLLRTELLHDGLSLSEVTARLARGFGVDARLLPMTDVAVGTQVTIPAGTYSFEEWFVKLSAAGPVEEVCYHGADSADPAPGVLDAISDADQVILAPSNPVSSIEPILALPGVRDRLSARRSSVTAVTPIINGAPMTDQGEVNRARARRRLMAARGLDNSATAVAGLYRDLAATFVLDCADGQEASTIEADGYRVVLANTIISDPDRGSRLAETLLRRPCAGHGSTNSH